MRHPLDLLDAHWLTLHGLCTTVAILVYILASHVMRHRRHPAAAIAWVLFILLLPYVALPAFLLFGSRKQQRPSAKVRATPALPPEGTPWAIDTIAALGQPEPAAYRQLKLHADGQQAWRALLDTIDGATRTLDICTFILGRDDVGHELVQRLAYKASQGVQVRLLLDGLGSLMSRAPKLDLLRRAGGQTVVFVPPLQSPLRGRTNLRDHRKLVVADAGLPTARLWCGGRNLAAEYFEGQAGALPWRDLSLDLRGPLVAQAAALFEQDWAFSQGTRPRDLPPFPPAPEAPLPTPPEGTEHPAANDAPHRHGAQLMASGPDQVDDTVYALLVTATYRAQRQVRLITPYFVPDPALLMALCLAARRGVQVELLLPARSNHRLSDLARSRALRSLALAGGRVWLAPNMLHAKLAVFDDDLALAGSANLDSRSLFLNYELMLAFHDGADVQRFNAWFEAERAGAQAYVPRAPGLLRDIAEGLLLWLGFQL
ncbi:MAG TPA: PLDc N-terminal domain-containing protein [Candidatus Aquabacterium excrementipullorum]|nr:PLDc N-terminal domain-containing protein [Candidatus Aquabacterium excrementipullorum]